MALSEYRYNINGALNTGDSVLANMERLANSATSWISFDMFTGKWDVVINRAEEVTALFDDSNIIGSIQLNIIALKDMYNIVEVQFPHIDLNGQKDYIRVGIPLNDRLPFEIDNVLTINYDLVNDPVQALYLGLQELKQSRLDKTITFRADYSKINIGAGAVIAVTNTTFGWTNEKFRVITVKEIADSDALHTEITALEYDDNVYSTDDLERYTRTNASGIISIGAIGKPPLPQVSKFEVDARPGLLIEADVPSGLVNGMEYWLTRDTTIGSDENRVYNLIGTIFGTGGNNLVTGETVELDYDTLDTSNLLVKVRGINGDITGPYSDPSGLINFNPIQVPDGIGQNTGILDANNGAIGGLLTANALLWLLNQLLNGNTDGPSLIENVGNLFGIVGNVANALVSSTTGITSAPGEIANVSSQVDTLANTAITGLDVTTIEYSTSETQTKLNGMAAGVSPDNDGYLTSAINNNKFVDNFTIDSNVAILNVTVISPTATMSYDYYESGNAEVYTDGVIFAQATLRIQVFRSNTKITESTIDWTSQSTTILLNDAEPGDYRVESDIIPTYDLNMRWVRANNNVNQVYMKDYAVASTSPYKIQITKIGFD
jgi:hypothetical protein